MPASYAYYPGCSGLGTSREYELSTRKVCQALGLDLQEIPDWSCCGSSPAHTVDHVFSSALSARNLALVEEMGLDTVLTPCPSCLTNLKVATWRMRDEAFRQEVNQYLEQPCKNQVAVKSVLQALVEDVGPSRIKEQAQSPLKDLKIAPYYGCIMNRPPGIMDFDDPENPVAMDQILKALGADVVDFPLKVECCGASYGIPRQEVVLRLSGKLLDLARAQGADALAVPCPLCQMNLDLRQGQINSFLQENFELPVFYYTQLMGLAFGLEQSSLGLDKLCVPPRKALIKAQQRQEQKQEKKAGKQDKAKQESPARSTQG
ncbi:MAG: CoB--CoM heterodisulfide reductase iron-sulfur subunit B family protein [Desulfohalobiaceae bacterium]